MQAQTLRRDTQQRRRLGELVGAIDTMDLDELQSLWKRVYGVRSFTRSKVYLRRMLVYRFDELRKHGSAPQLRGAIHSLTLRIANAEARRAAARGSEKHVVPTAVFRDPRLPPPGTLLRKEHGGRVHEVLVLESGCEYEGTRYRSLSAVAVKIYGGPVNGYAFFARALREAEVARVVRGGAQ